MITAICRWMCRRVPMWNQKREIDNRLGVGDWSDYRKEVRIQTKYVAGICWFQKDF